MPKGRGFSAPRKMKAAVLHRFGRAPRYEEFPDPGLEPGEILIRVRAVALENVDKAVARGTHYATRQFLPHLPAIVGSDGIGALEDGRLVGFGGVRPPYGSMAEWVPLRDTHYLPIPVGVEAATAAAVPSSTLTEIARRKRRGLSPSRQAGSHGFSPCSPVAGMVHSF
jgi:NADPH2:quinone reductase